MLLQNGPVRWMRTEGFFTRSRSHAHRAGPGLLFGLFAAAVGIGLGQPANAMTFSFDDFADFRHGYVVAGSHTENGVSIDFTTENYRNGDIDFAAIFDSGERGTSDDDLEGPGASGSGSWDGGNLAPDTYLGNMLIIPENDRGVGSGILSDPDDEAAKPAGFISLMFAESITSFGFDLVDVEGPSEHGSVEFWFMGMLLAEWSFEDLPNRDASVEFGNNTANRIDPFNAADFSAEKFDKVVLNIGGSGAVDNFVITPFNPVPEPTTVILVGVGIAMLARSSRRARRAGKRDLQSR